MRGSGWAIALGLVVGWGCTKDVAEDGACPIGSVGCPCTGGGTCDADLSCVGEVCMDIDNASASGASVSDSGGSGGSDSMASTTTEGTSATSSADTGTSDGLLLDVGVDTDGGPTSGCRKVDMLFVLDSSASMAEERNQLAAVSAFTQIITALEGINGGGISYRIGLTDDKDSGFYVPSTWPDPNPWFDRQDYDASTIAGAFNGAAARVGTGAATPAGCEHVLTSGIDLLHDDATGFVRDDAVLVIVLLTDVDDYGAYDQDDYTQANCGFPACTTVPDDLATLQAELVDDVKGGDATSLVVISLAGDPTANAGVNFCNQPGSCGCVELLPDTVDCEIFHATRLEAFTSNLGNGGVFADLCSANVPTAVRTAIEDRVDEICMDFEPAG